MRCLIGASRREKENDAADVQAKAFLMTTWNQYCRRQGALFFAEFHLSQVSRGKALGGGTE